MDITLLYSGQRVLSKLDIDNALKTLFDALKVPDEDDSKTDDICFCLLEDDCQIIRSNVKSSVNYNPHFESSSDVNGYVVLIEVTTSVTRVTFENLNFAANTVLI